MAYERHVTDKPRFTAESYQKTYKQPCELVGGGSQAWYKGCGIARSEHPLAKQIDFGTCAACNSSKVLVIAAQFCVHPFSGDKYFDYELCCESCRKFSQVSYSEN